MIRNFGWVEAILLGLFVVAYGIYLWRIIRISRALHAPAYTIIFKLALRSVAVALIIISILGPTYGDSKKEIKSVGKDIMMCVDLSKSMDAFDIQPTRLEKIKFELKKNCCGL
jgi:Ca-activated chloride channel family protein